MCFDFSFIVVLVKKLSYLVKEQVCELYEAAVGQKKKCVVFTMYRSLFPHDRSRSTNTYFEVMVGLCLESERDKTVAQLKQDGHGAPKYELDCCSKNIDIKVKTTYMVKLHSSFCNVAFPDYMPIQYQDNKVNSELFVLEVPENKRPIAEVFLFKRNIPKKIENYPYVLH